MVLSVPLGTADADPVARLTGASNSRMSLCNDGAPPGQVPAAFVRHVREGSAIDALATEIAAELAAHDPPTTGRSTMWLVQWEQG
jgi:hypothetical protein